MAEQKSFYPIVNIITGPPGIIRNGGIWKKIKEEFIKSRINWIMTHAVHFIDFPVRKKVLEEWFSKKSLLDWILDVDKLYRPELFVDSGGFKLAGKLHNKTKSKLRELGLSITAEEIFNLQIWYGARKVVSLDFPLARNMNEKEVNRRITKSINNAIKLLTTLFTTG